jgi:hypothetical protein
MSNQSETVTVNLSAAEALSACRDAIGIVGWKEAAPGQDDRLVAKFGFGLFSNPGLVEMLISEVGRESRIVLNASIKQFGPVAESKLKKQLAQIRSAIEASALKYSTSVVAPTSASSDESVKEGESVEERLARLAQMHKDSLITDAEYAEQRKRVLGDL